jgi:hypothetical protein
VCQTRNGRRVVPSGIAGAQMGVGQGLSFGRQRKGRPAESSGTPICTQILETIQSMPPRNNVASLVVQKCMGDEYATTQREESRNQHRSHGARPGMFTAKQFKRNRIKTQQDAHAIGSTSLRSCTSRAIHRYGGSSQRSSSGKVSGLQF